MAPENKSKKRKAAVPDDEVEKIKKVKQVAAEVVPKKRKAPTEAPVVESKKSKAPKTASATETVLENVVEKKPKSSRDVLKAEKALKAIKAVADTEDAGDAAADDESDLVEIEEIDDQTEALLKGFESDDDEEAKAQGRDREEGEPIPELDKKTKKKMRQLQEKQAHLAILQAPGVIYLGRIPHGFYENEMRQYFKQFGVVKNVRLSRNPKTGASKHYAFIEFESGEVAEIVAKTMDNYLMFGHILKCKVVSKDQVHDELFKGANRRFKKVPWNKLQGRALEMGVGESQWERRNEREQKRRIEKEAKLKELGLIYDFESPALKSAKDVPKQERTTLVLETAEDEEAKEEVKAIEAPKEVVATTSSTVTEEGGRKKKTKKAKVVVDGTTEVETVVTAGITPSNTVEEAAAGPDVEADKPRRKSKRVSAASEVAVVAEEPKAVPASKKKAAKKSKA